MRRINARYTISRCFRARCGKKECERKERRIKKNREREGEQELKEGSRLPSPSDSPPPPPRAGRGVAMLPPLYPPGARYLSLSGLRGEKGQDFGINNLSESNDRPAAPPVSPTDGACPPISNCLVLPPTPIPLPTR